MEIERQEALTAQFQSPRQACLNAKALFHIFRHGPSGLIHPGSGRFLRGCIVFILLLLANGCAPVPQPPPAHTLRAYTVAGESLLQRNSPVFLVENNEKPYNRIGTVRWEQISDAEAKVFVDPSEAAVYAESRTWRAGNQNYTNLIYRIHFQQVPMRIVPFYLSAGRNTGLLVIVTLEPQTGRPLLYTTVHTCGCYLAFIPTTLLPDPSVPPGWREERQYVYGESLPAILEYPAGERPAHKLTILLRHGTHRIKDVWFSPEAESERYPSVQMKLLPLKTLSSLPGPGTARGAFFETEGARKGYVVDSEKLWERLLVSWWALDWRVGEDKRLGRDKTDGITFYTSLKPWARDKSDLRDFATFLHYWGWRFK